MSEEPIAWEKPEPLPPRKNRTGLFVGLGCGLVLLLGLGTCAGGLMYGKYRATHAGADEWTQMRSAVSALQTDEGARAFYSMNPGLVASFPAPEDFISAVRAWRPRLSPLPQARPNLLSGKLGMKMSSINGQSTKSLTYEARNGARLQFTWTDGLLSDLQVE